MGNNRSSASIYETRSILDRHRLACLDNILKLKTRIGQSRPADITGSEIYFSGVGRASSSRRFTRCGMPFTAAFTVAYSRPTLIRGTFLLRQWGVKTWNFNLENSASLIPIGFGAGKVFQRDKG